MFIRIAALAAALAAGVVQALLSAVLFPAAFSQQTGRMLAALFAKIAVYGALLCLLAFPLRAGVLWGAAGYAAGLLAALAVWYVKKGRTQMKGG